jgi:hypothetical protein
MTENALDDALADLVEAFGHVSEAELQAFLDVTPRSGADLSATTNGPGAFPWPARASVAPRDAFGAVQAARA